MNNWKQEKTLKQTLFYSYNMSVEKAYIIRIKGNDVSEKMAERCARSCVAVDQEFQFWDAYDGTGKEIIKPNHHNIIGDLIKITNHYKTKGEIACALSHISLWSRCVLLDQPIVILEHDAVMVKKYDYHEVINSICYLGSEEQYKKGWMVLATPPHATEGPNYHFICRSHAYAIDPMIAKNLLSYVIKNGINESLDMLIRADLFPIHQKGLFAYDDPDIKNTTIINRASNGRSNKINTDLEL